MTDVELRNVRKTFGKVVAVDDVSFQVREGEFLTLLGPSGCGKTTTMRIIAGLEMPTSGQVLIRNQDVTHLPPYKRDVSLMFQSYALFPHKAVYNNVAFGLKYRGVREEERKRRVREALELVHLPGIENRYPSQLSGGQQQRVALARALVVNPALILLDEPLSNLDLKLRERMRVELKQIQEQIGITFIFVTHDQEEALTLSDRIAVMKAGNIIQMGTPREVYERPATEFVAGFIGQSNIFEARVQNINNGVMEVQTQGGWKLTLPRTQEMHTGEQLAVQLRSERIHVYRPEQAKHNGQLTYPGKIERTIYSGNSTHYFIRLDQGETLLSIRPTTNEPTLEQGLAVIVGFNPEDVVFLRG